MKFELTDSLKRISDLEIINDLRSVANLLEKQTLKMNDYSKQNGAVYSIDTASKRFGNWEAILKKAGLTPEKNKFGEKTKEELINDIKRVANELNNPKITFKDYMNYGRYDGKTIQRKFGGWIEATKQADLKIERIYTVSTEELLQNLFELWTLLGRQPKRSEVISPDSKYHAATYTARFGSWKSALKSFIEYINSNTNEFDYEDSQLINITGKKNADTKCTLKIIKRTPRGINLRLRWIVLKRDNFSCKNCGRSPAKDPTIILNVDHKIPWSKGGETIINNLEVLCQQCNLGKSNLTDI